MAETASIALVYIAFLALAVKRLLTYVHVLQQEDYENKRLTKWIFENKVYDKRLSFSLLVLGGAWFFIPEIFMNFFVFICFTTVTYLETDPRKNTKKKLVATARAKRLFFPALILIAILAIPCFYFALPWFWIFNIQTIPLVLIIVNASMQPFEAIIQHSYWNEAYTKLRTLNPTVIGITGSFGKTSVKHILGHILKTQAPTLVTPGSVNTSMGITRIIRENLEQDHKYFVVEMGAYGIGSIDKLCRLTAPDLGIITAIGHAHYERFRSLDTVAQAKFELAKAVMEKGGITVTHERTLRFPYPRQIRIENRESFVVCGEPPEADAQKKKEVSYMEKDDLHIQTIEQKAKGLDIKLTWKNKTYNLDVPLYGIHHGHNAALAFAAAMELGIPAGNIQTALQSLPQISHRLEVIKHDDGTTLIDDAYNSNPLGFRSALDLLAVINASGRNILVTPGMIELGIAHDEAHEKLGNYAGEICDVAIVINGKRIGSFIKGFKSTGGAKTLIEVSSFREASKWVQDNKQSGDIILIENDLPDMYEKIPKM